MGPPTAPQQRKGPEQNDPPLAAVDSTGRGKTSQPAPPPPTASFIPALGEAWNAQMEGSTRTRSPQTRLRSPQKQQMAAEGGAVTHNSGAVTRNRSKKDNISGGGSGTRGGGARARGDQRRNRDRNCPPRGIGLHRHRLTLFWGGMHQQQWPLGGHE